MVGLLFVFFLFTPHQVEHKSELFVFVFLLFSSLFICASLPLCVLITFLARYDCSAIVSCIIAVRRRLSAFLPSSFFLSISCAYFVLYLKILEAAELHPQKKRECCRS